jgi:uncharacterized short protein YbdD (DUF466 family)
MPQKLKQANRALRKAWQWLREVTGDAAYENYLRHCAANESRADSSALKKMTRAEFYSDALRRKYSTINRCC